MKVIVLGGGIIGTASAWYLAQAGHEVSVVERLGGVARDTSLANGAQVSVSHSEPWANPHAPWQALRWLGRDDAPLLFRLRWDPMLWGWGLRFLRECLPSRTARNIRHCVRLALYSRTLLGQLRRELNMEYNHLERGILHFYTNRAAFEQSRPVAQLMQTLGCNRRTVSAQEVIAIEPALSAVQNQIVGGDYCAEDESGDVHVFTQALAQHAQRLGVQFLFQHQATRLLTEGGRAVAVEAMDAQGWHRRMSADAFVVALGAYSRAMLQPLGIDLPLYPGKGYSATFDITDSARVNTVSLTDDENKVVYSRLGNRLRVAGTAEFNGFDRSLNAARCEALRRQAQRLFPGACNYQAPQYWCGLRPVTPSNVPLIGATGIPGVYLNTGHGTLGWTMGVGSGKLIADVVSGKPTDVELPPAQ